jgi:hypothetical protein
MGVNWLNEGIEVVYTKEIVYELIYDKIKNPVSA